MYILKLVNKNKMKETYIHNFTKVINSLVCVILIYFLVILEQSYNKMTKKKNAEPKWNGTMVVITQGENLHIRNWNKIRPKYNKLTSKPFTL